MIILTIILVGFFYVLSITLKRWHQMKILGKTFPTPPTKPFFGIVLNFPSDPAGIFRVLTSFFENYGKNLLVWGPYYDVGIWLSDPKDVETVLANPNSKTAKKSIDYDNLVPWLGTGLLISWGEKWFQRRKVITPSFHFSILEEFIDVFNRQSDVFLKKLTKLASNGDFDIYTDVTHFTLDVICEASMGIQLKAQSEPDSEYAKAVKDMSVLFHKRMFHVFRNQSTLYELLARPERGQNELVQVLHKFTRSVIEERRQFLVENADAVDASSKKRKSFLDMLLHATVNGKPLSDEDIREEVDTFMFEGHDTTASGVAFAIFYLSQYPEVQDKLYSEIKEVLGESCANKYITYQDLNDLTYLDLVIKETLRIAPPVPYIGRELTEDTKLGGTIVPKGVNLILAIYNMQNNPEYFPNPGRFEPDRFLDPSNHPFVYTPFSAGARNCIGQKFAVLEMKTVLAKIVANYRLLPAEKNGFVILQADLILKSANGMNIRIEKR